MIGELQESLVTAKVTLAKKTKAGQFAKMEQRAEAENANSSKAGLEVTGNVSCQLA